MKKYISTIIFALSLGLLCSSCSHYRLAGTPTQLPFASVYVKPVRNVSYAPQAAALLTNAISVAVMNTPDLRLANDADAHAVLETELIDYRRDAHATNPNDTALASAYRISAKAKCTLKKSSGEIIFKDRIVSAETFMYMQGSPNDVLISDEYQNMPVLMRELGNRVKDAVIGIW